MPVILLTNRYSEKVLSVVKEQLPAGFNLISLEYTSKGELIHKADKADYFLVSGRIPVDKEVINSATKLKMVQRTGVGIDTIDLNILKEKNIPVYINSGINSISVAEHTILLILSVLRRLNIIDSNVKAGKWAKNDVGIECHSLNNKTVGIIGIGNIGRTVVKMLHPFGVKVLYYDTNKLSEFEENKLDVQYCTFDALLKRVDILSLHCPLTPQSKGLIGAAEMKSMKSGAIIINTARGPLIDEAALVDALKSGHVKGAGLDVFEQEPPDQNNPLFVLNNAILTPHVGGLTLETFGRMIKDAFENIKFFETGRFDLIENKKLQ